jgi:hypothetical protein
LTFIYIRFLWWWLIIMIGIWVLKRHWPFFDWKWWFDLGFHQSVWYLKMEWDFSSQTFVQ